MKINESTTHSPLEQLRRRRSAAAGRKAPRVSRKRRALTHEDEQMLDFLLSNEQDLIDHPEFHEADAEQKIYAEAPDIQKPDVAWYSPVMDDATASSNKSRTERPGNQVLLSAAEERVIFKQLNYARHCVRELQREVWASPDKEPSDDQARELLRWKKTADQIRAQIAETNLALVLAMAKRTRMSDMDFADLVSEGNMALMRAVDKFDCGRGFKFSTYACRAILKAFSRQGMKLTKYRQRFPTDFDPKLEKSNFLESKREEFEQDAAAEVKRIVTQNRADLTPIERQVIEHRFGVEQGLVEEKPMTLEQIGQIIGVTKERVRQIQNKALVKIREELESTYLGKEDEEAEEEAHDYSLN